MYDVTLKSFERAKEGWQLDGDQKLEQSRSRIANYINGFSVDYNNDCTLYWGYLLGQRFRACFVLEFIFPKHFLLAPKIFRKKTGLGPLVALFYLG